MTTTTLDPPPPEPAAGPPPGAPAGSKLIAVLIPVAGWAAGALVFFRSAWSSGFDHLMGNDGDTRLIAYICEHWFRVLHGQESWRNMPFFAPVKDLLGWSDAFFLYQVFYAPLREAGCGPVLALQLTTILLSAVGFISFYCLVRAWFRAPALIAVAGAAVFTFANNLYLHAATEQLAGIYLIPPVLLIARRAWAWRAADPRRSAVLAAAAGLLWGLVFFTTYYMAAYSVVALAGALIWTLLLRRHYAVRWLRSLPAGPVAAGAAGLVVGLVPAVLVYAPAHSSLGGVSYRVVLSFAVSVKGLANLGPSNFFWSRFLKHLHKSIALGSYEATYAVTPLLLLTVIIGGAWLARRIRTAPARPSADAGAPSRSWTGLIIALTALSVLVLPVKIAGHPAWLLLWILPGFDAIRAIDRVDVMAGGLAALAMVAIASEAWDAVKGSRRSLALAVLIALIVVEQLDTYPLAAQISRTEQDQLLASITAAPAGCRYFYVVDPNDPSLPFFEAQVDAMFVADRAGVPTLNGYTGYDPKGWGLEHIGAPTYLSSVRDWEASEHLGAGSCSFDLGDMKWGPG